MCAPDYFPKRRVRPQAKDMQTLNLLHDEGWEGWNRWFEVAGLATPAPVGGLNCSDAGLLLDAAIAGQGIALASTTLAAKALSDGRLMQPFEQCVDTGLSWFLVTAEPRLKGVCERQFWSWMLEQAEVENPIHEEN